MPKEKNKTLVLLDSHAIIHRAYHALPEFFSTAGEPTGALYGLSTMLMKIITDLKPDYIVACYDLPQKTFRHEAYGEYKAGRGKTDDALIVQLQKSRDIFKAFNVPIYDAPGFEADDILGTVVEQLSKEKINIIIASGDMDTMQLVSGDKVCIYTLKKGINDTILYNEKSVVERFGFTPKFLPDYKGLRGDPSDNIIGIKGIGEKTATDLIKNFGTIEDLYKKLSSKDADKIFKEKKFSPRIIELLKQGEEEALFSKVLATIRRDAPVDFKIPEKTFWEEVDFKKVEKVFIDFEFKSLFNRLKSFFNENGNAVKIVQEKIEDVDEEKLKEASVMLWLLNSENTNPTLEDILHFTKNNDFQKAYEIIAEKIKKENLEKVYEEIEKPIIPMVQKMEERGILIDQKYFENLSKEYHKELEILRKKIYEMSGTEFNINSPKQLGEVLFVKMGIKAKKKGASGNYTTNIAVLEELEADYPIIKNIMEYRELQKLLSTYIDVIPKMVREDGRLHAKFLQNGTSTGRFSSQDPNLQNLPIKSDLGKRIREGFIAGEGHSLLALDYSQIELRVLAILSGDETMINIFKEGKDIHQGVASFVFNVPMESVDRELRRKAKVINFGIIYGMGVNSLRKNLGGTKEEAQTFYDNYFKQFSKIKEYMESVKTFAEKTGYTETLFGRKRFFPNIKSRLPFLKSMALRTATNAPIQGTATADIIKLSIRFAEEDLKKAGILDKVHLVLQIHDELVYEVENSVLEKAEKIIQEAMEGVLSRSYLKYKTEVPLSVNYASGKDFGGLK
jgi:DNA polymerase-1